MCGAPGASELNYSVRRFVGSTPKHISWFHTPNGRSIVGLCALALSLRIIIAVLFPGPVHPDETFQYLEQANRIVQGVGMVPWEFRDGARSWFIPALLALIEVLAITFGPLPNSFLMAVSVMMAVAALPTVVCGFLWGRRAGGLAGGLVAGTLNACWFEPLYFSVHPLADSFAAALLVPGLYLCTVPGSRRRFFGAGILLGLTVVVRVQLAPAIGLVVLFVCFGQRRAVWVRMIAGGLGVVLLGGLMDWVTWSYPFQSTFQYIRANLFLGKADEAGVFPWWSYLTNEIVVTHGAVMALMILALQAGRRQPALVVCILGILISFSAIGHKEARFILPVMPLVLTLAGIGTVEAGRIFLAILRAWWPRIILPKTEWKLGLVYAVSWAALSLWFGASMPFSSQWHHGDAMIRATRAVNEDQTACGLGIYPLTEWHRTGGASHLRHDIPLYAVGITALPSQAAASNYVLTFAPPLIADWPKIPKFAWQGYTQTQCWSNRISPDAIDKLCLWHRPGPCNASAGQILSPN